MSRIGKQLIIIPGSVKVEQKSGKIGVSGPLGEMEMDCPPSINIKVDDSTGRILVENKHPKDNHANELHGTIRSLIANMITGVSRGFEKKMEIYGSGYNVKEQAGKLICQVGFSHPVEFKIPKGVKVKIEVGATKGNDVPAKFSVSGIDKQLVGQFVSVIRKIRPPEPYQGKGIRYADEHIKRKVGKAFAAGTA